MSKGGTMRHYRLPAPLLASILNYLREQPYKDVAEGIHALQQLQPIEDAAGDAGGQESAETDRDEASKT